MVPDNAIHVARTIQTGEEVARGHTVDDVCRALEAKGVDKSSIVVDLLRSQT